MRAAIVRAEEFGEVSQGAVHHRVTCCDYRLRAFQGQTGLSGELWCGQAPGISEKAQSLYSWTNCSTIDLVALRGVERSLTVFNNVSLRGSGGHLRGIT